MKDIIPDETLSDVLFLAYSNAVAKAVAATLHESSDFAATGYDFIKDIIDQGPTFSASDTVASKIEKILYNKFQGLIDQYRLLDNTERLLRAQLATPLILQNKAAVANLNAQIKKIIAAKLALWKQIDAVAKENPEMFTNPIPKPQGA